jgi:hypothetical protein
VRTWPAQAGWWTREYRRRLLRAGVRALPTATRVQVLYFLERRDAIDHEIDTAWPSPYVASCLVASRIVAPRASIVVDANEDYERSEGHFWPELRVSRFKDVLVDELSGLVFYDGRVLKASGHSWRSARDGAFLSGASARAAEGPARRDTRGPIAPMGGVWNYYHFLVEALPRLLHVLEVEPRARPVFSGPMPGFADQILNHVGIAYEVVDRPEPVRSSEVWLCDPTPLSWPHPHDLDLLRSAILARCDPPGVDLPEKIFISRRHSGRPVVGEDILEEELRALGFTPLHLETLPFPLQVAHLQAARVVIAGHGAGESNMVFMDPGTTLIEFTTGECWTASFRHIAAIRGVNYRLLTFPATPEYPFGRHEDALPAIEDALAGLP